MFDYWLMKILKKMNIKLIRNNKYQEILYKNQKNENFIKLLGYFQGSEFNRAIEYIQFSEAQFGQDFLALFINNFIHNGFFVEFGATNGKDLSNTYLLEKKFGWSGILAEPAKDWHEELATNRSCNIVKDCVWKKSDKKLFFRQTEIKEVSTIEYFSNQDRHANFRKNGKIYEVNTISLIDLLEKFNAPPIIDYLSIDTEGSEFEILENFNFSLYSFRLITCEHNYTENREKIYNLLTSKGYTRILEDISGVDDWYIMKN